MDARAAALHQRSFLLQLMALELHYADAAVPQHRQSITILLQELFLPPDTTTSRQPHCQLRRSSTACALSCFSLLLPALQMGARGCRGSLKSFGALRSA